ncbi:CDP-alcohol phosphatidyltransferase family protein [Chloroflexota bacterium]
MAKNTVVNLRTEAGASIFKSKLADSLTLSRGIISLVILSLSLIGKDAYLAVVILSLVGGATDMFDGKAARRYLKSRESRLGRYDLEIDTFLILCIIGYFTISGIVIPRVAGFVWIGLAVAAAVLYNRRPKALIMFEVPSVLIVLTATGLYDLKIFLAVIAPVFLVGVVINYKRVLYLLFEHYPRIFSR